MLTPSKERNDQLIRLLQSKGATALCSRCGNGRFEIVGESEIEVSQVGGGLFGSLYKQKVPTVVVACSNCGNISTHSVGVLSAPTQRAGLGGLR
jgi:hypothetical protein